MSGSRKSDLRHTRAAASLAVGFLFLLAAACPRGAIAEAPAATQAAKRPNVLFIAIDDLNDWVGCLGGHPQVKTPNIDRLARRGVLFTNAHCQAPICNPSRVSLLTGRLPSSTGVYQLSPNFRSDAKLKNLVTLPQHFAAAGYETLGVGKIFHGRYPDTISFQTNGPRPGFGPRPKKKINYLTGHALWDWGAFPEKDSQMGDAKVADWTIEQLRAGHARPFFLAVGFYRPHVPLYVPQKWLDLYPEGSVRLPPTKEGDRDDLPEFAKKLTNGLPAPRHEWFVENHQWRRAVAAYLASVTFVDNQLGRVLDALDASGAADNTVVVLFSDHGWHLGEKFRWAKRSLWERSTRVPMIVVAPGRTRDEKCSRPVGLVDLYPTLIELCGLPPREGLDGHSLAPLVASPQSARREPAITTYEQNNHAVRSEHWRYIRYADGSQELYDHRRDPNEWNNLAGDEKYADVIAQHARWIPKVNAAPVLGSIDSAAKKSR